MMGYGVYGYGPFHWLWFIVMIALVVYPAGRILSRMGFSPLWSIAMFIPVVNLVVLWVLAFTDWPRRGPD
jgi:hypothetical protein